MSNRCKIYLDFNMYINAGREENKWFKNYLLSLKNNYQFIYAFPIAEELYNNKDTSFCKRIPQVKQLVSELTDDYIIGPTEDKKYAFQTVPFEKTYKDCAIIETKLIADACGDINCIFSKENKLCKDETLSGLAPSTLWKNAKVVEIIEKFYPEFKDPKLYQTNSVTYMEGLIPALCSVLDLVGFGEKGQKTYRSSVNDHTHLIYASKCDFFLSSDKICCNKAKAIFYLIKSSCNVIYAPNISKTQKKTDRIMTKISKELGCV